MCSQSDKIDGLGRGSVIWGSLTRKVTSYVPPLHPHMKTQHFSLSHGMSSLFFPSSTSPSLIKRKKILQNLNCFRKINCLPWDMRLIRAGIFCCHFGYRSQRSLSKRHPNGINLSFTDPVGFTRASWGFVQSGSWSKAGMDIGTPGEVVFLCR